jgi:putative transposase
VREQAGAYGDPVLSAFDLDFFDGERRLRARLSDGLSIRFEHVPPVREFRWAKGGRGFAGWYWSAATGDHVGYESWLDCDGNGSGWYDLND